MDDATGSNPIASAGIYYPKNPLIPLWCSSAMVFGLVAETVFINLTNDARTGSVDTTKLNWILPPLFSFLPPLFSFLPPRFTFLPSLFFLPSSPFSRP
jgi:hypothetical protein